MSIASELFRPQHLPSMKSTLRRDHQFKPHDFVHLICRSFEAAKQSNYRISQGDIVLSMASLWFNKNKTIRVNSRGTIGYPFSQKKWPKEWFSLMRIQSPSVDDEDLVLKAYAKALRIKKFLKKGLCLAKTLEGDEAILFRVDFTQHTLPEIWFGFPNKEDDVLNCRCSPLKFDIDTITVLDEAEVLTMKNERLRKLILSKKSAEHIEIAQKVAYEVEKLSYKFVARQVELACTLEREKQLCWKTLSKLGVSKEESLKMYQKLDTLLEQTSQERVKVRNQEEKLLLTDMREYVYSLKWATLETPNAS